MNAADNRTVKGNRIPGRGITLKTSVQTPINTQNPINMKKQLILSAFLAVCCFCSLSAEESLAPSDSSRNMTGFYAAIANDSEFCPIFEMGWTTLPSVSYDLYHGTADDYDFMDLDVAKSIMLNITLFGHDILVNKAKSAALAAMIRLNVNNFVFDRQVCLLENAEGILVPAAIDEKYSKSKLTTAYLDMPVAAFLQMPEKPYGISVALVPGIKINEHSKIKSPKEKEKMHTVRNFRLAVESRIQFVPGIYLFGMYDLLPMFKDDRGPDTHPFSIGIGLGLPNN